MFYNIRGYDCHLFIKQLCEEVDRANVIAQSKDNYISFTKYVFLHEHVSKKGQLKRKYLQMKWIDSYKVLSTLLQKLVDNIKDDDLTETKQHYPQEEQLKLMPQTGAFPYSFLENLDKLNVECIPLKKDFFDKLNGEHISSEDYKRARNVWTSSIVKL